MSQAILEALKKKFGDAIERTESAHGDECAVVKAAKLVEIATFLRDDPALALDAPVFCTTIDLLHWQPVGPAAARPDYDPATPRFEVCWQLRSSTKKHRVRIKVALPENKPQIASLTPLWPGFNWQERETFDMYGIRFEGHPDLRRIYLYEEFVGYPLRKDYPKEKRQPLVRRTDLVGDH